MRPELIALFIWIGTAVLGLIMATTWVTRGGLVKQPAAAHQTIALPPPYFPASFVLGHFAFDAGGLLVWGLYVFVDDSAILALTALGLLLPVILLGFSMFGRWIGSRRARLVTTHTASGHAPPESRLPAVAVVLHGLLGVATFVLVGAVAVHELLR